jgi:hypothetical protein
MIRLLHDPVFAATLVSEPDAALLGVELSARERSWLLQAPPAAWRTDPDRPGRVLAALVDEYPLSTALAPERADGFFAAPEFHAAVQSRGSLAHAFGVHLARGGSDPRVAALATLERAIAEVRRAGRPAAPRIARLPAATTARLVLTPRARVLRLPAGTLDLAAALRGGARGGDLGPGEEAVLVLRVFPEEDVTLEALEPALAALLDSAAAGATRAELQAVARFQGAEAGEDDEILDRLVSDGLLIGTADSDR